MGTAQHGTVRVPARPELVNHAGISSENVTKNFENGLFKRLTAKDKENHDPNEVWESGIQYIKQQLSCKYNVGMKL